MKRNFTKKSAPSLPETPAEPKRIKISASMSATLRDAIRRVNESNAAFQEAAKVAHAAHQKYSEVAEMHDKLFATVVSDGGATVADFQHGFEVAENRETNEYELRAKAAPNALLKEQK